MKRAHGVLIAMVFVAWAVGWFIARPTRCAAQQESTTGDATSGDATSDSGDEGGTGAGFLREQTIYITYSKLRDTFEKEGRGVFLPYEKFQELWQKAREAEARQPEQRPPVVALITEIESEAVVEKDVVHVTAKAKVEVLRNGWHEIPLRLADTGILSARLDGAPARIMRNEAGGYKLLLEKTDRDSGLYELTMEYAKAFTKSPGQNSVSIQAPQAPVNRWRVRVPQSGVKVNIHPLIAATEPPSDEGSEAPDETVVLAFVGAAASVRIEWNPKAEGAAGLEALATVQAEQEVTIDEGVIRTRTRLGYEISRAEVLELKIEVPGEQKVVNVFDPNVRKWDVQPDGDVQKISVQLFQPTRGKQNVMVELERFSEDLIQDVVEIPVVKALDVGRQQGIVVVRLSSALRTAGTQRNGLLQLDANELPQSLQRQEWHSAHRYVSLPFQLAMTLEKVQPRLQADQLVAAYLEPDRLTLDLLAIYEIERAGVFQFQLDVPEEFEILQVRGHAGPGLEAAVVDSHHLSTSAAGQLVVNLGRKALGRVGLFVELQRRVDDPNLLSPTGTASEIAISLPKVTAASVERLNGKLLVYAPESLRASPAQTDGLQSVSFAEAMQVVTSTREGRFPTTRPVLAYAYSQQQTVLALSVQRRRPQITARQLVIARVESGVVKYETTLIYDVLYSGVKSLRIDVPDQLVDEIRNTSTGIKDQTMQPQPDDVAEGYVAWSLTGETEFLGTATVHLTWEERIAELGLGSSLDITPPVMKPMNVDRTWGQIVIVKGESLDVRESGETTGLRPIDPQNDVMDGRVIPQAARAFEFHDDWALQFTVTRYQLEEVKRTSIERAVLRLVVGRDDRTSVQALYRMRTARQRLEVNLPPGFNPNDGFNLNPLRINGRTVDLERGNQGEYFVPLVSQTPDKPFLLELRYTVDGGYSRLDFPVFPSDPAVQKVYLCAFLPSELALLGSRGPWTNELAARWKSLFGNGAFHQTSDTEWVRWVSEGIALDFDPARDFQTDGRLHMFSTLRPDPPPDGSLRLVAFHEDALSAILFLAIAVPGVVLVTRPISQRLAAVAILLIALVFTGVFLPTFSMQVFDEILFSAVFLVLAVWFLLALVRFSRERVTAVAAAVSQRAAQPREAASGMPAVGNDVVVSEAAGQVVFQEVEPDRPAADGTEGQSESPASGETQSDAGTPDAEASDPEAQPPDSRQSDPGEGETKGGASDE